MRNALTHHASTCYMPHIVIQWHSGSKQSWMVPEAACEACLVGMDQERSHPNGVQYSFYNVLAFLGANQTLRIGNLEK